MKKFRITINGNTYEVEVEELGEKTVTTPTVKAEVPKVETPKVEAPKAEAKPAKEAAPQPAPKKAVTGKLTVNAPMPGTILSIKVKPGTQVKKGDCLMILEAMKMENEILAPEDGKVVSIEVSEGTSVNTGDLLAVIE